MRVALFGALLAGVGALGCAREEGGAQPSAEPAAASVAPAASGLLVEVGGGTTPSAPAEPPAPPAPSGVPAPPGASEMAVASTSLPPEPAPPVPRATPLALPAGAVPFMFTAAFDGSQRFTGWLDVLQFARNVKATSGKPAHFTFFINTCYFDTAKVPSTIGRAQSRDEVLVRRALAQLAVNEGHEIASHGVGHHDGSAWTAAQWREEFDRFHEVADALVFSPIRDEAGRAVFPRFSPRQGVAAGQPGAACQRDADCEAGRCADLGDAGRLCAPPCNLKKRCPSGLVCGAPFFREDEDICLPPPDFPVTFGGETLFDARGNPRLGRSALRPLRARGYRAPFLGANDAMVQVLMERGYRYDTSLGVPPGPPRVLSVRRGGPELLELGLVAWSGVRAIPMDYNYLQLKVDGARMTEDYESAILQAFAAGVPFNIGHHFARWEGGAYQRALEDTVRFAAAGCPDDGGRSRCPGAVVASFAEVVAALEAARARAAATSAPP